MKRISFICLLILFCSLPATSQFWINFGWNEPHCQNCLWMEQAMHLSPRQAADYHKTIHKYGQKIEKEARRHYRHWNQSAKKIYSLRMERDRRLQHILTPAQFRLYIRFVREHPQRIHDYKGWYNNPNYPSYHPSYDCRHYEDRYWTSKWNYSGGRWNNHFDAGKHPASRPDRPMHPRSPARPGGSDRPQHPDYHQHRPDSRPSHRNDKKQSDKKHKKEKDQDKTSGHYNDRRHD